MAKQNLLSKLLSRLPGARQDPAAAASQPEIPALKLVFFIVNWNQAHVISDIFAEEKVRFHCVTKVKGTASSELLDILGIGADEKALVICLEQTVGVPVLLREVRKKLRRGSPGAGIAFTVPLSAINDPVLLVFKQSIHKNEKIAAELERKHLGVGENMADDFSRNTSEHNNDLIVSVINHGYSDDIMNTAREAGASGGTVINARGQAHEGTVKFFGISVQEEKEIVLILTGREQKVAIMRAICEAHGLNSNAQAIVFSLPVDNVLGLSYE